jgi:hypothetical protein
MITALVVHQYRARHPLMPVKQLATTLPTWAILVAMCASAAAFGLMELVLTALQGTVSPATIAVLFLPEFGAALLTAVLFCALFRTRFTPLLALGVLVMLTAAAALLAGLDPKAPDRDALVAAGSGLIGPGVGASVSPALFITGFSLRSAQIQRVFALVELLRGVTAFLVSPILVYLATTIGASLVAGTRAATWICLGIAAGGAVIAAAGFLFGGTRLQVPDLERWQSGEPAWTSPPLLARLRRDAEPASVPTADEELERTVAPSGDR